MKADEVRSLLGLANSEEGDELIGGRIAQSVPDTGNTDTDDGAEAKGKSELNAAQGDGAEENDGIDDLVDEEADGFVAISDDIAAVIEKAADAATDYKSFQAELSKLVKQWSPDKIAECIAVATFKARALGAAEFDKE